MDRCVTVVLILNLNKICAQATFMHQFPAFTGS